MLRRTLLAVLSMGVLAWSSVASDAATIAEFHGGTGSITGAIGQSVTTLAGGPYNNIAFNFYDTSGQPFAPGTAYIYSQAYGGFLANLGSGAGFIAASTGNAGGVYQFNPSVTLQGNTQYFVYENQFVSFARESPGTYTGGTEYQYIVSVDNFTLQGADTQFLLTGVPVTTAVPLPSALSLGATSLPLLLLSLAIDRRKLRGC